MILVYSYYVLDIIHEGHLLYMRNAKALAGKDGRSIVGILTDEAVMEKKPKPTMSFEERMGIAKAIEFVDLVVPQKFYSPIPNVYIIKPDILVESQNHVDISKIERAMSDEKCRIVIFPYYPDQSSTKIKEKIRSV